VVLALFMSGKLDHTKAMYTELSLAAYLFSLEASFEPKLVNAFSRTISHGVSEVSVLPTLRIRESGLAKIQLQLLTAHGACLPPSHG
jgi:hypothetical protein